MPKILLIYFSLASIKISALCLAKHQSQKYIFQFCSVLDLFDADEITYEFLICTSVFETCRVCVYICYLLCHLGFHRSRRGAILANFSS